MDHESGEQNLAGTPRSCLDSQALPGALHLLDTEASVCLHSHISPGLAWCLVPRKYSICVY